MMGLESNISNVGGMGAGIQPTIEIGHGGGSNCAYPYPVAVPSYGGNYGGNCGNGFGGDGIWAILLLALLGRGGFGGFGNGTGNDCTVPVMANQNLNGRFDALSDQITCGDNSILGAISHNGVIDAVRAVDAQVCAGFLQTQRGFADTNSALQAGFGQSRLDTCNGFALTNSNIAENKYAMALGFANTDAKMAQCLKVA